VLSLRFFSFRQDFPCTFFSLFSLCLLHVVFPASNRSLPFSLCSLFRRPRCLFFFRPPLCLVSPLSFFRVFYRVSPVPVWLKYSRGEFFLSFFQFLFFVGAILFFLFPLFTLGHPLPTSSPPFQCVHSFLVFHYRTL